MYLFYIYNGKKNHDVQNMIQAKKLVYVLLAFSSLPLTSVGV